MTPSLKVIISSKKNLKNKYGSKFTEVENMLSALIKADSKRNLKTQVIYVDDSTSASKAGIKATTSVTFRSAKKSVDEIYKKLRPDYIVLFGAQDVFPFQEIINPVSSDSQDDSDEVVPSDLPYACDKAYNTQISAFTGPTRVVGRIPDIPGHADIDYLKAVFDILISYKPVKPEKLCNYFAITAEVWKKSTQESLGKMFGNSARLKNSPPSKSGHSNTDLEPLTHFYNCHGSPVDSRFFGQKGNSFPTAQHAPHIDKKISAGTIVAAECCYGAELFNPSDEDTRNLSIANTYLKNKALAFTGSSTIAYGPAEGNGLADLITQYFIKNVMNGASTGRALLEARHKFLSVSGPHLDAHELKTLAQFHLLGDPSVQVTEKTASGSGTESVKNRRLNLLNKGLNLAKTIAPCEKIGDNTQLAEVKRISTAAKKEALKQAGFTGKEKEVLYKVKIKDKNISAFAKSMGDGGEIFFRTLVQRPKEVIQDGDKEGRKKIPSFNVLVLKESGDELLGWKLYHSK